MKQYKRIKRDLVKKGHVINYYLDTIEIDNEKQVDFDFIEHKGAAALIPIDQDGKILLVRQYRNAIDRDTLEIPAGGLNVGEDSLSCAIRECEEETGYAALKAHHLIDIYSAVGFCNEKISIYYATNLTPSKQRLDEDEFVTIERYRLEEILTMISKGLIQDAKTVAGILAYQARLYQLN